MVEGKLTPGPWEAQGVDLGDHGEWGVAIVGLRTNDGVPYDSPTNGLVAYAMMLPTEIYELDSARAEANARLIAAAPDLLEALRRLENVVRILPPDMDEPNSALAQARAAIAKAEGSSQ